MMHEGLFRREFELFRCPRGQLSAVSKIYAVLNRNQTAGRYFSCTCEARRLVRSTLTTTEDAFSTWKLKCGMRLFNSF